MAEYDFSNLKLAKKKVIAGIIVVIIVVLIIADGLVSVPAGHVGVVFDQGRGVLTDEFDEGIHIKIPFWQKVYIMDVRTQEYTMSAMEGEGAYYSDDSIEARSKDGQIVYIDATILYHIDGANANVILQTLGTDKEYKQKIVRPKAREVIREVVAKYNAVDLVSEVRVDVVKNMNVLLTESYESHKITLEEVVLRNVTFSQEFAAAIEQKQVAFQKIKTAEYQKQEAEQLKEKKIIEAEADAEAIRLKGETLRTNPQVIQYEFVQKISPSINWGILPDDVMPLLNLQGLQ